MSFLYPRVKISIKLEFENQFFFLLFSLLFISFHSNLLTQNEINDSKIYISINFIIFYINYN